MSVEPGIEYRQHPAFEFGATRHRQRRKCGCGAIVARCAYRADHLQQLSGVERGSGSIAQDIVVASVLAFDAHLMRRHLDQRVEPEERDRKLRQQLSESVEALYVSHLVDQHESTTLLRPAVGILRQ